MTIKLTGKIIPAKKKLKKAGKKGGSKTLCEKCQGGPEVAPLSW